MRTALCAWLLLPAACVAQLSDTVGLLQIGSKPEAESCGASVSGEDLGTMHESLQGVHFAKPMKVLVFWAVGFKSCSVQLVRANLAHLRWTERISTNLKFDVFLNHYDQKQEMWQNLQPAGWYRAGVQFSAQRKGIKIPSAADLLAGPNSTMNISAYSWIWILDEDLEMRIADVGRLIQDAESTGSFVVGPSLIFPEQFRPYQPYYQMPPYRFNQHPGVSLQRLGGEDASDLGCNRNDALCRLQHPQPYCRFRYTNFVEVSFPLFRPEAFRTVADTHKLYNEVTIWGIDHVWCNLLPKLMGKGSNKTSCAILDATPVIHMDLRTLPKYHDGGKQDLMGLVSVLNLKKEFWHEYIMRYETHQCVH